MDLYWLAKELTKIKHNFRKWSARNKKIWKKVINKSAFLYLTFIIENPFQNNFRRTRLPIFNMCAKSVVILKWFYPLLMNGRHLLLWQDDKPTRESDLASTKGIVLLLRWLQFAHCWPPTYPRMTLARKLLYCYKGIIYILLTFQLPPTYLVNST